MSLTVLALGHRFPDLAVERQVLAGRAELVDGNAIGDVPRALRSASAVLLGTQAVQTAAEFDLLDRCALIVRYGVGADNVELEAAARRVIAVANVPDYCLDEVSDHTLALLLSASRRLHAATAAASAGSWSTEVMAGARRLSSRVLGLVGCGRIGTLVARKAAAFGMHVMVADPYADTEAPAAEGVETSELRPLLEVSDFVSLHCPLTPETNDLMDAERLAWMRESAWLINTSRGGLVDVSALVEALDAGRLAGACLDVLPDEPAAVSHPAVLHLKVVVTPHVARFSSDSVRELRHRAAEAVALALAGGWPQTILNGVKESRRLSGARA